MKLTFSWNRTQVGTALPLCTSDGETAVAVSPLAHVLDDDGGLGINHAIRCIDEGKKLALASLQGVPGPLRWSREYFCAEMWGDRTIAMSEIDPACRQVVTTRSFLGALEAWQAFLAAGPADVPRTVDVAEADLRNSPLSDAG